MFHRNNDRLPFDVLEGRVAQEVERLTQAGPALGSAAATLADVVPPQNRPSQYLKALAKLLKPLRKLAIWGATILHARRYRVLAEETAKRTSRLEEHLTGLARRLEQLNASTNHLAQEISSEGQKRHELGLGLKRELASLRGEIIFHQQRFVQTLEVPAPSRQAPDVGTQPGAHGAIDDHLSALYVQFEDEFRGSRADIKSRFSPYVDFIANGETCTRESPLLDVGCGRGEWIELLGEKGIPAYGIDRNSQMVATTRDLGLDARHEDLLPHLRGLANGSRGAITAFHVVEHLEFSVLVAFLDEAHRVLRPGGALVLETPNCETLRVGATTFFNDPTHHHPIPPLVLEFLVRKRGYCDIEVRKLHPFTEGLLKVDGPNAQLLNNLLFGPQDYSVLARRP